MYLGSTVLYIESTFLTLCQRRKSCHSVKSTLQKRIVNLVRAAFYKVGGACLSILTPPPPLMV